MAEFVAKLDLKLTSCATLPSFSESIELPVLNGATSCTVTVREGEAEATVTVKPGCVDNPRLLILRPSAVLVQDVSAPAKPTEDWLDIDKAGVSRDQLAEHLSFKSPSSASDSWKIGRSQFYFEGLLDMVLGKDSKTGAELIWEFEEFEFGLEDAKKKVRGVKVEIFMAYGPDPS